MMAVNVAWIDDFVTELSQRRMRAVDEAIHFALRLSY
jgi:hypothetical protein